MRGDPLHAFPDRCRPVLRDLLEATWKTQGHPHVHVGVDGDPPRLVISVVSRDWPGLLDIVTTYLHILDINLSLIVATVLRQEKDLTLSGIYIEAPLSGEEASPLLATLREELPTIIRSGEQLRELLLVGTRKLRVYQEIVRALGRMLPEEERNALIHSREIAYFVHARSEAYLTERSPETLAHIIWTNWRFQQALRREGRGLFVDIRNLTTRKEPEGEHLTGITVVGLDSEISLDVVMDTLREYDPGFRRKYDKEFVTPDGIAVIRLEITDAQNRPYPESVHPALTRHLLSRLRAGRRRWSAPPGIELIGRLVVPRLVDEAAITRVPQMLLLPQLAEEDAMRFILVISMPEEVFRRQNTPLLTALVDRLNRIPGLHVTGYHPPRTVPVEKDGETVPVVHILVDLLVSGSAEDQENLHERVQEALRELVDEVRDFDSGMRKQDTRKLDEVLRILEDREVNPQFARRFYYAMNAFQRLSLSPALIVEEILFAEDVLREHFQKDAPVMLQREVDDTLLVGMATDKDRLPLDFLTRMVERFQLHMTSFMAYGSSVVVLGGKITDPEGFQQALSELEDKLFRVTQQEA